MRRFLAAAVAACFIFFLWLPAANAEGEVALTVDTAASADGQAVVCVHAANADRIDSLQFRVNYDPAVLRLTAEPQAGDWLGGALHAANTDTAGTVAFAFASAEGLSGEGTVLSLTFAVVGESGSAVTLTDVLASRVDEALGQQKAFVTVADGGVTVGDAPLPAPVVTPWPVETPTPTPEPTPEPTPTPTPTVVPSPTAAPEPQQPFGEVGSAVQLVIGGILLAVLLVLFALLIVRRFGLFSKEERTEK